MKYSRKAAAQYITEKHGIAIAEQTLANQATAGKGPRYSLMLGRAIYDEADLDAWVAKKFADGLQEVSRRIAGGDLVSSIDLGIRAAVRAAVARESDYWVTELAGFMARDMTRTPAGALMFAQEYNGDKRDAWDMVHFERCPRYAPRRFLHKVTP